MIYYDTKITKDFIEHRDRLAADLPGENRTFRADFEWPEWYLGKIIPEESGHTRFDGFSYDTTNANGTNEFKYLQTTGLVHIGPYTQEQIFDNYILWNWNKPVYTLSEGDIVSFKIIKTLLREYVNPRIVDLKFNYNEYDKKYGWGIHG